MKVRIHHGDSRDVLRTIAEGTFDSCVTDPPYALVSITKRFGKPGSAPCKVSEFYREDGSKGASPYIRAASGFMGQQWDTGETAFDPTFWEEVLRVMKPGAHLVAFGGTRTYHRMACAIEDAGFEIRDQLQWLYGSGFPKSHDVSKGIDRAAGAEREVVGVHERQNLLKSRAGFRNLEDKGGAVRGAIELTAPATDDARAWEGWGTALKPACEPIVLARKPLTEKTVAANVLAHGTGAINIEGCRVEAGEARPAFEYFETGSKRGYDGGIKGGAMVGTKTEGRWPANVIHDGSDEVLAAFPQSDGQQSAVRGTEPSECHNGVYSGPRKRDGLEYAVRGDFGSAARFFYTAKADADDRLGSKHPTVKPLDLMQWLVRLVTRKGGLVLDPFAGTGTTGEAAYREGCEAVLIEREAKYVADIDRRLALLDGSARERKTEIVKAKAIAHDPGPLFAKPLIGG